MIIPTATTNLTLATVPTATFVPQATGAASASSFASLGINEILTIAFGIVASLTAVMAVMIGCMQLKRARSPRPAGDRRVNAGNVDDIELRPVRGNARAASAPPAPGRTSEGSTPPGSNRMKNGATM
ncbi:hypothetical protein CGLO_07375 [Colletotrichum gloeosporioides Cg-14]|uniref:Transmembrane protein n=1 Tax=Colletotrichum gloeosporioides (strain Cg-14) TaxID=1237896 RepID=T0KC74_COLGC|nr:hypothetical protein CGLO_07375 [Colletotrichum gloeosporioides Cg-14]